MSLKEKLEQVHALLINEEHEKASLLFHEAFVEAAREVHKQIMEEEDWLEDDDTETTDESAEFITDEDLLGEVEDDSEEMDAEPAGDEDMGDFGDAEGEEGESEEGFGDEGEMGEEGEDAELEDRIADLESELEALKAEFETLQSDEMEEPEHADMFGGEEGDATGDEEVEEGDELATMGDGPSEAGHPMGGGMPGDKRHMPQGAHWAHGDGDEDGIYEELEEFLALDESFELESVSNENKEAPIGTGEGSFTPQKTSPIPQKKLGARMGGEAVDVNAKGKNHKGYDREGAPAVQKMAARKNVLSSATADLTKVEKEGDKAALINKTESEFGKPNVTSPIGSKGTVQAKGLTEGKRVKKS